MNTHTPDVPAGHDPLYGRESRLAVQNFPGPGRRVADLPPLVAAYAAVKAAAARANTACGVLDPDRAEAIVRACREIGDGVHADQFPTPLVVGGGGTSTNMNVNEVVAALAARIGGLDVHPNDHVNASQSTNDTYPTAMALTVLALAEPALDALSRLADGFAAKAAEFEDTPHLGRTCLRDAVSVTAGQTHRSHAAAVRRTTGELRSALAALHEVPLGATAVGTGVGAPDGYRDRAVRELSELTGRPLVSPADLFDALAHLDPYAAIASAGARAALTMAKIAADLRFLSSGPTGGIGEVVLPRVQAGSSIMPAKVNPVIPEYVMQLSYRVRGAAHTVEMGVAAGELELNVMEPVVVDALATIMEDLTAAADTFARRCVAGLSWNGPRREANLEGALDRWVDVAASSGYDTATALVLAGDGPDRA